MAPTLRALVAAAALFPLACVAVFPSVENPHGKARSSRSLEQVLADIVGGPLREKWIVLVVDPSAETIMPLDRIIRALYDSDQTPPLLIFKAEGKWDDRLPPPEDLRGRFAFILVVGSEPEWLVDVSDVWTPAMLLVVNVNASYDARPLLELPLIQRAISLALLEASDDKGTVEFLLFTSRPFSRDPEGGRRMKLFLGSWDDQLFSTIDALFPERFETFGGEVLHVASDYDDYPLIYETDDVDGMNILILKALGDWLNFTFTTTSVASDDLWGSLENGTWTGLLGDVYRGEKNITVNYFTVVYERARDFDYTATYFTEGFGFALRVPPPLPAWRNLFLPFTPLLWASVVGAVVLTTPVIYLLIRATEGTTFTDVAILVFKSLVQQSSSTVSKKGAARLLVGVWWIGGLILALSYTGNLIAVLTVPVFPSLISTIEGLADSNFRVSMVDYGEFVPEALATSADQYLKALGDRMDLVENHPDDEISYRQLLDLLLEGRHAITETYSYLRNMLADDEQGRRHTYVLREQIYTGALAFFLPKHTPWRPRLDRGIRRLVEAGLVDKWYRDLMGDMAAGGLQQQQQGTGEEKALTISNLQGPFLALALGLGLASLAFLLEVSLHRQAAAVEAQRSGVKG